ncbi:hypothetical protein ACTXT7_010263 [Hymenolepis weldensis]
MVPEEKAESHSRDIFRSKDAKMENENVPFINVVAEIIHKIKSTTYFPAVVREKAKSCKSSK